MQFFMFPSRHEHVPAPFHSKVRGRKVRGKGTFKLAFLQQVRSGEGSLEAIARFAYVLTQGELLD